ncbi:DUF1330 domain-containing protein [Paraburkholderia tuberum]|uniref:Uncharacterized conserved protein, DUF1330 family n=1 Tax=Paraburkholderia tuberum TaxID=157910 RepID=A0A1H1KGA3_9BURK|nr:DUF1330 domain-containing protein [Paraburkholderia tuberum]SDR61102.1 Uncharacterized conserved protein, DUF1330 family [Paraburkholderia tuberum]
MKTGYAIVLAMLAGIGTGVVGVHSIEAQVKPPVYMVGLVDVSNADGYAKEYLPRARASIKAHGGVTLAAGPGTVIEGAPPGTRFVILRWDSLEQLKDWRDSLEYTAAHKDGEKYAKFNVVAVNGVQP